MKPKLFLSILIGACWATFAWTANAQVPGIINYQGRVSVGGTNFDGTGSFKFALVNTDGSATYWSNGVSAVSLNVNKGLYSVLLGDTGIANMTCAIPPAVFANMDVRLRVWVNDGVSGLQQLSPDQRIAAVGYALAAANAFTWQTVTGTTQQAVANTGYVVTNSATPVTVTLPALPSVGDVVRVSGPGAGGWTIAQNSGQSVLVGNAASLSPGATWTASESNRNWSSVAAAADRSKLVAVVFGGQIYTSIDSGAMWTVRENNRNWSSVASSADGSKLVATDRNGQIHISTDSGVTWTGQDRNRAWRSVASSADGSKLVAAENGGQIYTSTDSGVTWTAQAAAGTRNWFSVASSADGSKLVAAENGGQIYTSTDSGVTWMAQATAGTRNWFSVASSSDGSKLVAAEYGGQIYTSTDSGATWTAQAAAGTRNWSVASSSDGSKLVASDYNLNGRIYTSTDSGVTWTARASTQYWGSVASSADGSKLVAVAGEGRIYTSTPPVAKPSATTPGTTGYVSGGQGTGIELQYIGNNQFLPLSHEGTIFGY